MAGVAKIIGAQRDWSAGELDESIKRDDENQVMRTGARQMANLRILNSRAVSNRPGRTAVFFEGPRVDQVLMAPNQTFYLVFGAGYLRVYNTAGTQVFNTAVKGDGSTAIPWTANTVKNIVYDISGDSVFIFYADGAPFNVPQVLTWDGVSQTSTWTLTTFAELIAGSGQKRTLFYRISPQNVTLQPNAVSGLVHLTFSTAILVSGMVGTRIRYCNKQIIINTVTTSNFSTPTAGPSQFGTGTVVETLPIAQQLTTTGATGIFNLGDVVIGATSGANGIVTGSPSIQSMTFAGGGSTFRVGDILTGGTSGATGTIVTIAPQPNGAIIFVVNLSTSTAFVAGETATSGGQGGGSGSDATAIVSTTTLTVQLIPEASGNIAQFTSTEKIAGPNGTATNTAVATTTPQAVGIWDNEVMNNFRGWPSSGFWDQNRLGLCNFPSVPSGIAWSAIGVTSDLYVGALASNAIFELAPGRSRVFYVVPGMESSEFVFCDNAIYYIPISVANPLQPGSVAFNGLSQFGCAQVQPRRAEQSIIFVKLGGVEIGAVQALGAYYRPFVVDSISEMHSHLFTASTPIAIAIPTGPSQFEEKYLYIALANGSLVVGKYAMRNGMIEPGQDGKPKIGWVPWSGSGTATWISALQSNVFIISVYSPLFEVGIVEVIDATQYLDGAVFVNNLSSGIAAQQPGGKGPLWYIAGGSVTLIDLGTRFMGTYQVDANGNIVPQGQPGENLSSSLLVAGQPWTATLEPFTPIVPPGQDQGQRIKKRRATRMGVYVSNSTGFVMQRLFSGPITPNSPALGTVTNSRRIPAWNIGDNALLAPPQREGAYFWRPLGRAYDPRYAVVKDTPGPQVFHEVTYEAVV